MSRFFISELIDTEAVRGCSDSVYAPYAAIIVRLCNAQTPTDACKAFEDLFKVSLQLTFLSLIAFCHHKKIEIPVGFRRVIADKWLKGGRDLTEGERLSLIKDWIRQGRSEFCKSVEGKIFVDAFGEQALDAFDHLLLFKNDGSHNPSGGEQAEREKLGANAPYLMSLLDCLRKLATLALVRIEKGDEYVLMGATPPIRQRAGDYSDGMYLKFIGGGGNIPLFPLIRAEPDSEPASISMFSRAADRSLKMGEFKPLGPGGAKTVDDGRSIEFIRSIVKDVLTDTTPLVGLNKQTKELQQYLESWATGKSKGSSVVLVIGEEGTGKSSLVRQVVRDLAITPLLLTTSGISSGGEARTLVYEILAQLFHIDSGYDGKVVEMLLQFSENSKVSGAARIAAWLKRSESREKALRDHLSEQKEKMGSDDVSGRTTMGSTSQSFVSSDNIGTVYADLINVIRLFAREKGQSAILWLEDAQLYESQEELALDSFFLVAARGRYPEFLLIGEFRADRTRDLRRLKERYQYQGTRIFETKDLDKEEIRLLLATRLGIPPKELPQQIAEQVFKTFGGNPKATLDLLTLLEESGELKKKADDRTTGLLLSLPSVINAAIPKDLKELSKTRILRLHLSEQDLDALTLLAWFPGREIPVRFVHQIMGADCEAAILRFEELELVVDCEDTKEWRVRFEHLAAREASVEIAIAREQKELRNLNSRLVSALQSLSTQPGGRFVSETTSVIRKVSAATRDAENLAPTIAGMLLYSDKQDLPRLKEWALILNRGLSPSDGLTYVRDYLQAKIGDFTEHDANLQEEYLKVASRWRVIESLPDKKTRDAYVSLAADAFAASLCGETQPKPAVIQELVQFLVSVGNIGVNAEERSLDMLRLNSFLFWDRVDDESPEKAKRVLSAVINSVSLEKLRPRELLIFLASSHIALQIPYGMRKLTLDNCLWQLSICEKAILETRDLALSRGPVAQEETRPRQVETEVAVLIVSLLEAAQEGKLRSVPDAVRAVLENGRPWELLQYDFEIVRAFWYRLKEASDEECRQGTVADSWLLALDTNSPLRVVATAEALSESFARQIPAEETFQKFLSLLKDLQDFKSLNGLALHRILEATNIIGTTEANAQGRRILEGWIQEALPDGERLDRALDIVDIAYGFVDVSNDELFGWIDRTRLWTEDEKTLIELHKLGWDPKVPEDDSGVMYWRKSFDQAKKEFLDEFSMPDSRLKSAILSEAVYVMRQKVLGLYRVTDEEDQARLREFRTLLEHLSSSNIGNFTTNARYWKDRWTVMAIQGEYRRGLDECEGMLKSEKLPEARNGLIAEAAKLLVPRGYSRNPQEETRAESELKVAQGYVKEWHQHEPISGMCALALTRLASFMAKSEGLPLLAMAEESLRGLVDRRAFTDAELLAGSLRARYYEFQLVPDAERVSNIELHCAEREIPKQSREELLTLKNNLNYIRFSVAIGSGSSIDAATKTFEDLERESSDSIDTGAIISYNYAIATAYAGNVAGGFSQLRALLTRFHGKKKLSDEMGWLWVFVGTSQSPDLVELRDTSIRLAAMLSGCFECISINRRGEALMWFGALAKILKDTKIKDEHIWQLMIFAAKNLNIRAPLWVEKYASESFPNLRESIIAMHALASDNNTQKMDQCACGSGKKFRECCLAILRA